MLTLLNFLLKTIHYHAEQIHKNCRLKANLFGSFLQGTCLQEDSDIDVIINFENIKIGYKKCILLIDTLCRTKLRKDEFIVDSVITPFIRVPFITVTEKSTNFKIDIIYDNPLGIMNSQLFYTYLNIH